MTEVVKHLSPAEQAALSAQVDKIAAAPRPTLDTASGKQFVFVAHFDGTNNDKDNLALSGSRYTTNVAQLSEQMKGDSRSNPNFESRYYQGVGTDPGLEGVLEASIRPSADMRETADRAYKEFTLKASEWLKAHPEADPLASLKVMATGFSRGAGTAAVFSQMLHERGLTDPATGKVLIPPGQLGLAGGLMFDPVTTGYDRNSAFSPESKNITVVQANNEYRTPFKGVDHSGHPGVTVVPVTGNHCDIGGGTDNGIAARVLSASTDWVKAAQVPISDVPPGRRHQGTDTVHHERDLPKTTETIAATRSPLLRSMFPVGSRVVEGLAGAADYPVTHDPRKGLTAPRQLTQAASEETVLSNGWRRFEAAEGTVWRKDFPQQASDVMVKASLVEPHLKPGVDQRRLDLHLQSVGKDGKPAEYLKLNVDGKSPAAAMQAMDQKLGPRVQGAAVAAPTQSNPHFNAQPNAQPHLHPALRDLSVQLAARGYSPEQALKISSYAQNQVGTQDPAHLKHAALHKDGQSVALVFRDPPFKGIAIEEALNAEVITGPAANAPTLEARAPRVPVQQTQQLQAHAR